MLALLLHESAVQGTTTSYALQTEAITEQCCFSQAPTTQQLLDDIYKHIASQAICLDIMDTAQVPANKAVRLPAACVYTAYTPHETRGIGEALYTLSSLSNPHKYYLYGLKKLLI